jgi:hypothetical protein
MSPVAARACRSAKESDPVSRIRLLGFSAAMVVSALVGGTVVSAVMAAPGSGPSSGPVSGTASGPARAPVDLGASGSGPLIAPSTAPAADASPSPYCLTFRKTLAAGLGVTEDQLVAATKDALGAAIDQAVADGKLTADRAAKLKASIAAAEGDGCRIFRAPVGPIVKASVGARGDALVAAAGTLDMTPQELRAALQANGSLQAVAAAQGVAYQQVSDAALAAVKRDADARVATGDLTRAQADRLVARIEHRLAEGWIVQPRPSPNG